MKLGHGCRKQMAMKRQLIVLGVAALLMPGVASSFGQSPAPESVAKRPSADACSWEEIPSLPWSSRPDETRMASLEPDSNVGAARDADAKAALSVVAPAEISRPASTEDPGPVVVKVYEVADLLDKLTRDEQWPDDMPRDQIRLSLAAHLQIGMKPDLHSPRSRFIWNNDQLVVSAPTKTHDRIAKEIEQRREHSFRQISVEVRMLQGAAPWNHVDEDGWQLLQQDFANVEQLGIVAQDRDCVAEDIRIEHPDRPTVNITSGRNDPIVFQVLDDEQFRAFIDKFSSHTRNTIMHAPKVTLFDGQQAEIADASQQPFVTDVQKVIGEKGEAFQPVIKTFWEGTKIQLSPVITKTGHRMVCRFRFASIDGCRDFHSPRFPNEDVMIQHPIVATSEFECAMDIPDGKTLIIGGLFPQKVERKEVQNSLSRWLGMEQKTTSYEQVMYVAITPRTLEPQNSQP